jgi:threonine/homoserine/homoserine lactone efflux protein
MWVVKPLLDGLWQGAVISLLSFGPAFFLLINTSIRDGFRKGLSMALGVFLSDLAIILLIHFGLAALFENIMFKKVFSLAAGISMMFMGINSLRYQYRAFLESYYKRGKSSTSLLKGFGMNLINPFILVMWLVVMASVSLDYNPSDEHYSSSILINLMAILLMIFVLDTSKVYLSSFLGKKLNKKIFYSLNKYMGLILIAIGVYFLYHFLQLMEVPHTNIKEILGN